MTGGALALLAVAAAVAVAMLWRIADVLRRQRRDFALTQVLALFAPAMAAAQADPKQLLTWYPLSVSVRKLLPETFAELDAAVDGTFPFNKDLLQAAHARCSAEWLAWERTHDAEYSLKIAQVEDEMARAGGAATPLFRTRLAKLDQEKLERYQQRYEEYVKTAKAIGAFADSSTSS
jgi:hypothetical protein